MGGEERGAEQSGRHRDDACPSPPAVNAALGRVIASVPKNTVMDGFRPSVPRTCLFCLHFAQRLLSRLELTSLSLSVNLGLDSFTEGGLQTSRGDVRLLRNRRGYEFAPCCTSTLSSSFSANATEKKT